MRARLVYKYLRQVLFLFIGCIKSTRNFMSEKLFSLSLSLSSQLAYSPQSLLTSRSFGS